MSNKEIFHCIKLLKHCKSAETDSIINEALKAIAEETLTALNKLFNLIYNSGQYPSNWRQALIVPIFKKKGDHDDPNCYRGIALISCLAKLFDNIVNERLTTFLKKNKVISVFQIGFSKKARTADDMFVLRHLIDSHVKQNRNKSLQHLLILRKPSILCGEMLCCINFLKQAYMAGIVI